MTSTVEFVSLAFAENEVSIEYQWVGAGDGPLIVFLHEGLGSVSMWKGFPAELCAATGSRGLVYSRPGYGQSTPRQSHQRWSVDFMQRQAYELLPTLLEALQIDTRQQPPWLFGHSDGGSIALLYAAGFATRVSGLVLLAPHILVEELSISSIQKARQAYLETDLKDKLARYHSDVDSAFWGWNDIWLNPDFRGWSIEDELASITCPLLALQGIEDEYGTLEQIHGIKRRVVHSEVAELADCGHSPQRDQPREVIRRVSSFLASHGR